MTASTIETSTATPSAYPPPQTLVTPTLSASTTAVTLSESSQENPNVQRDKPDSEPESDQEDGYIDPKTPKYEVETFAIKEVDNIWCTSYTYTGLFWERYHSFIV